MEQKDFSITTIGGLTDVSDLLITEDTLNNNISLSHFGEGVRNISFCALTYQEPNRINKPFWQYDPHNQKIEGSLPLDFVKASSAIDRDAQKLVCSALFELFDKVSPQVSDFNFEALKKTMLEVVDANPVFAEKIRLRVYSDTGMMTGDNPEFAKAIDLSKYGKGVRKLFFEASFLKNPQSFLPAPPKFDKSKRGLYISVVYHSNTKYLSSALDRALEQIKPQVQNFDFELFKADILHFLESLQETA